MSYDPETGEVEGSMEDDYELIGRVFEAQYKGHCTIDWNHVVKRGDRVARVQHGTNPMVPVSGVACSTCVKLLPWGKR